MATKKILKMDTKKAMNLVGLIEYQEGSVVSRTVIDKEVGTITLFAFDKDQGLSEHTAPYDAFVYIADGKSKIIIDGEKSIASAGEFIILPAGKPHSLSALERFKMLLVMIRT